MKGRFGFRSFGLRSRGCGSAPGAQPGLRGAQAAGTGRMPAPPLGAGMWPGSHGEGACSAPGLREGQEPLENPALVVNLGRDDAPRHLARKVRVQRALILPEARKAVRVGRRQKPAQELAIPAQHADGDSGTQKGGQGRGTDLHGFAP